MTTGFDAEKIVDALRLGAEDLQIPELTLQQEQQFLDYCRFLLEYNNKVNLTAITDPVEIALKHFIDSLSLQRIYSFNVPVSCIDIGSGAGFPGVPLLIAQPGLQLTLLDAVRKRLLFLEQLLPILNLTANTVHSRAEDAAHNPRYRAAFQLATARAVAPLPVLLEYAVPFLVKGGHFIAYKGPAAATELAESRSALKKLGVAIVGEDSFSMPDISGEAAQRTLLLFVKEKDTDKRYPRTPRQIKSNPL